MNDSEIRGWLIVFVAFLADALSLGGRALFVVVILFWEDEFGWSRSDLSSLMALVHVCNGITTPISGLLIDKYEPSVVIGSSLAFLASCFALTAVVASKWQAWLVYGVLCGSAYGLLNLNVFSVAVMDAMPPQKHGLAVGIVTSGSTFGQFALVPLFTHIARTLGWRTGYLVLAACTALLVVPALYLLKGVRVVGARAVDVEMAVLPPLQEDADADADADAVTATPDVRQVQGGGVVVSATDFASREIALCDPGDELTTVDKDGDSAWVAGTEAEALVSLWLQFLSLWVVPQYGALAAAFFLCGVTTTGFVETWRLAFPLLQAVWRSVCSLPATGCPWFSLVTWPIRSIGTLCWG